MMKFIQKIFMTICFGSLMVTGQSQVHHNPINPNDKKQDVPALIDWFLSTGNWQNDPQLYVREIGEGSETILMVHGGWGGEYSGMVEVVKGLEQGYRFIFYDQRGSLRSPFPDSLITFNHHIEDIELLRKELKLDKLNIIGHSMGAVLASAYASNYPQRIKQLTLLAPAPLKEPLREEDKALQHQGYLASQEFLNRSEVMKELDKYSLNRKDPQLSSREETSKLRINFGARMLYDIRKWPSLSGGGATYKGHVYHLTSQTYPKTGWDFLQEFKNRSYPVSIIVGDHDFLDFGNGLMKKWVSGIPHIKLSIIENAGHIIWLDQPEIFKKELLSHLNR